jgi:hypothetical protein
MFNFINISLSKCGEQKCVALTHNVSAAAEDVNPLAEFNKITAKMSRELKIISGRFDQQLWLIFFLN